MRVDDDLFGPFRTALIDEKIISLLASKELDLSKMQVWIRQCKICMHKLISNAVKYFWDKISLA